MAGKEQTKTAFNSWLRRFSDDTKFNNTPTDNPIFTSQPDRQAIFFRRPVDNRIFGSPTPDIVEITPEDALTNSEDFVLRLTSLEGMPEEVRRVPEQEKENLKSFWAALIGKPALSEQLLEPLQILRSDANQLIPQLQDLTDQVQKQLSAQLPKNALSKLEAVVRQINIAPPCPPMDDIFNAIKAESDKRKSWGDVEVIELINSLSNEARNWLGRLLLYLVQNPELEADLRAGLRECRWRYVQHDRGYYLLFGQTAEQLVPRAWIEASWNYIQHFRCNFGFFFTEAMLYPKVTLVGTPDVPVPITEREEKFLRDYLNDQPDNHKLERLWVRSADELKTLLDERVARNISFEGGNIGFHTPQ